MLIHFGSGLLDGIREELANSDAVVQALQNLAQARAQGDHVLTGEAGVFAELVDSPRLSPSTRGIYRRVDAEQAQVGSLRQRLCVCLEISSFREPQHATRSIAGNIVHVPLIRFQRNDILQPVFLVGENLLDCQLFFRYSSWFSQKYLGGTMPTLLRAVFVPGGGDTTDRILRHLSEEQRYLTLCITDSDRATPASAVGQTSSKCSSLSLTWLCAHFSLETRSAENLLSPDQIRAVIDVEHERHPLLHKLSRVEHLAKSDAWKYLPLKDGLRELVGPPKRNSEYWYWNSVSIADVNAADGLLFPGISSKLLLWIVEHLLQHEPEDLPAESPLRAIWEKLATIVTSWGCGSEPIRS